MTAAAPKPVKLTANEHRALVEINKGVSKVDWHKVHGHTRHALERKKMIEGNPGNRPGWRLTAAGLDELRVPDIFADLFEKEPSVPKKNSDEATDVFRPIAHVETTLHDAAHDHWIGGVRLYCTASPLTHGKEHARWALQVRARVKTKRGGEGKQFTVANASMSREDLQWLRSQIDSALRRKI